MATSPADSRSASVAENEGGYEAGSTLNGPTLKRPSRPAPGPTT